MALLEVRNLSVAIRKNGAKKQHGAINQSGNLLEAVRGIDFTVAEGEIIALAGESGSGKTLSALSIPRLLPAAAEISGGEIVFDNIHLGALSEKELRAIRGKDIAMIFQEPRQALNPLLRVGEQIRETLKLHGEKNKTRSKNAALEMIEQMDLGESEKIFGSFPHQLSLGMCQRVMIAIAAISRPRLLIADEAASALDSAVQDKILGALSQMNREFGTAILFITHDFSLVRRFCSRLLVMYAGKIVEEGPSDALFSADTNAAHPYTKALISAIPGKQSKDNPLPVIAGRAPSIEEQFPGCPFAPRCPHTQSTHAESNRCAQCTEAFPPAVNLDGGRRVHCYLAEAGNV